MPGTIVVIEDDAALRTTLVDYLVKKRYAVQAAATLTEAIEVLARASPDAVVADINLPDGNGVDFCLEYAKKYPDAQWILMSGDHELVQHGQKARDLAAMPGFAIIDKPVPLRLLNRILAR